MTCWGSAVHTALSCAPWWPALPVTLVLMRLIFELFDVQVWRAAKNRLKSQLGLTPHVALVAKAATRTQMHTMGVDQSR